MNYDCLVLCIGDILVDVWWPVDTASRNVEHAAMALVSRPELRNITAGGVGIVAGALAAAGRLPIIISAADESQMTNLIIDKLEVSGVVVDHIHQIHNSGPHFGFQTPVKTRYINENGHILVRHDAETPIIPPITAYTLDYVRRCLRPVKCVTVSDYNKGCIPPAVRNNLISAAHEFNKPVYVDTKPAYFNTYAGADVFKINAVEFSAYAASELRAGSFESAIQIVAQRLNTPLLIVTMGRSGVYYCHKYAYPRFVSAPVKYSAGNCVGAGDVFLTGLVAGFFELRSYAPAELDSGSVVKLVRFGMAAASKYIENGAQRFPTAAEIVDAAYRRDVPPRRIMSSADLVKFIAEQRQAGKQIVFTNGCFDLLHSGHIALLTAAKQEGDVLVVAVDADANVARLKGPRRPVQDANTRAGNVAALDVVDAVCVFQDSESNTELERIIRDIAPDVLAKGADYLEKKVVGADFLSRQNPAGRVVFIPLVPNNSTTSFVNKIRAVTP